MGYTESLVCLPILFFFLMIFLSSAVIDINSHCSEQVHEISNNVLCATSKASDQPAHMRSLIRAFASRLSSI